MFLVTLRTVHHCVRNFLNLFFCLIFQLLKIAGCLWSKLHLIRRTMAPSSRVHSNSWSRPSWR